MKDNMLYILGIPIMDKIWLWVLLPIFNLYLAGFLGGFLVGGGWFAATTFFVFGICGTIATLAIAFLKIVNYFTETKYD